MLIDAVHSFVQLQHFMESMVPVGGERWKSIWKMHGKDWETITSSTSCATKFEI